MKQVKTLEKKEKDALNALIKLSRATDSVERTLGRGLRAMDLTGSQFGALDALYHLGPLSFKALSAKMLRTNGNLTLVARNLLSKGWVQKKPDAKDGRSFWLEITKEGERIFLKAFKKHGQNAAKAFETLSEKEIKTLARLTKKLGLAQP